MASNLLLINSDLSSVWREVCNSLLPKLHFLPLFSSIKRISILPGQHKVHFLTLFTSIGGGGGGGGGDYFDCPTVVVVGFVALGCKSTAMVMSGRSARLTKLLPGQA